MSTAPLHQNLSIAGRNGVITRDFKRWLELLADATTAPFTGGQSPGSFTVNDGEYAIHVKRLVLAGSERATLLGSGRLVICG